MVVQRKEIHDGLKVTIKACFCLRGLKELDHPRGDCPTADRFLKRLLYAIAANERWRIEAVDVTSAFLQGAELEREVFVRPPKEAGAGGKIWKMKKATYGLMMQAGAGG